MIVARFVHTNLVARDWRRLAAFYQNVFGCLPVLPERDLSGPYLEQATALPGAHIRGMHMRLPGWGKEGLSGEDGPTLEIFQYEPAGEEALKAVNRPGFGHIAFQVEDVEGACAEVLAGGGSMLGQVVTLPVAGAGAVTFAYARDPEGNILELQRWSQPR
jgi:catechol 2,3-dioxygenase-like lactoylglutathione lyase family enzyme